MGLFGGKSEEELRLSGTATTARIVYMDDTGKRRENGTEAKVKFQLKIDSGSARGRDLEQTKWVPVSLIPRVGETVAIRFDPDDIGDWAWGDGAMYQPAQVSAAPSLAPPPAMHLPPPPGMTPPPPGAAPPPAAASSASDDPMVEFIQNAAGPWGQVPGFKQMIESAMESNQVYVQNVDMQNMAAQSWSAALGSQGAPGAAPAAGPAGSADDTAERLRRLDTLLEQGLVTADEHRELRQKIIDSI